MITKHQDLEIIGCIIICKYLLLKDIFISKISNWQSY